MPDDPATITYRLEELARQIAELKGDMRERIKDVTGTFNTQTTAMVQKAVYEVELAALRAQQAATDESLRFTRRALIGSFFLPIAGGLVLYFLKGK